MYLFGKIRNSAKPFSVDEASDLLQDLHEKQKKFRSTSIYQIVDCLDQFSKLWARGGVLYETATEGLLKEVHFSRETIHETLDIIPHLLSRETLMQRIQAELGSLEALDHFTSSHDFKGKVKAFPLGTLLHVSAGNVFLGCIDSLLMGFLTKNISLLKLSSKNHFFPLFFATALKESDPENLLSDQFCMLTWSGGNTEIETFLKQKVNGIIAWGGDAMLSSYRKDLPSGVKLFEYGPKISIQILSKKFYQSNPMTSLSDLIAKDVCIFDQNACASPQNLFVEEGVSLSELTDALSEAFERYPTPRGELTQDEAVEILKEEQRAKYNRVLHQGYYKKTAQSFIHADPTPSLRPSPLNRTLIIKSFSNLDHLIKQLQEFSPYLQSCSYALSIDEKPAFLDALSAIGMKRFSPIGTIMQGLTGAPHDGRYSLRELVQYIPDEASSLEEKNGCFFASGGTTGEPKFTFYSNDDFSKVAEMLAFNFKVQGVVPGLTCANLFFPGQLWSSFLAVHQALTLLKVVQLPIGGATDPNLILKYLEHFNPDVILGIPTLLLEIATLAKSKASPFRPKKIFYAGEQLNSLARNFLNDFWSPQHIGSAGYASVDAGVIGYQCLHAKPGEHHVFSKYLQLKIKNDEGHVTAPYRKSFPVIDYATGDRMEWVQEPCACKNTDQKFKILGRIDSRMNIFGCRLTLDEIESALLHVGFSGYTYQVEINSVLDSSNIPQDHATLVIESAAHPSASDHELLQAIYQNTSDIQKTISFSQFQSFFSVRFVPCFSIPKNKRTGKIKIIQDQRAP